MTPESYFLLLLMSSFILLLTMTSVVLADLNLEPYANKDANMNIILNCLEDCEKQFKDHAVHLKECRMNCDVKHNHGGFSGYRSVVPGVIRVKEEQVNHRKRSKSKRPPTVQGVVRVQEEQVNDSKSAKSSKRMKTPPKTVY